MLYGEGKLKLAREYVAKFADGESYKTLKPKQVIPSIEGLAIAMGINRDTVNQWCKDADKSDFSDIVKGMMDLQASYLVANGLDNTFNASISKLLLTKHDYIEKTQSDIKSDNNITFGWKDGNNNTVPATFTLPTDTPQQ